MEAGDESWVRSATFWAAWFFAGFTVGYTTSKAITWTTDKLTDYLEAADASYATDMQNDLIELQKP